ncbi:MAG: histidine kinase [Bryobacterales bacterium]|nr:histidine kinase [Bryobacterales bacterium]MBV9397941.1 histidine kinase [Bryobacterales bacterium]
MNRSHRDVGKSLLLILGLVTVVLLFQFGGGKWPPLPMVLRDIVFGFTVCVAVSALAFIGLQVARGLWRYNVVLRWGGLVAAMTVCAAAGLCLAMIALLVMGLLPARLIGTIFRENIVGVITTTIIIGSIFTVFGSTKARLEATELELQTQRLERERAEKLAAEAKLASLSSRVQPHFLFNTLNSISALVRDDPALAERTIERLSSLLRASLNGREEVPLEQELRLADDYLEIQRTRLGERLRFSMSAAPDVSGTVPPFSVQTLVENSVRHAGEKRPEGVDLRVIARRVGSDLTVDVIDNGTGFDPNALKAGHGLDTLIGRLRELYGERAGVEFRRAPDSMTVRLRVPCT